MKLIVAIVRPERLHAVLSVLDELPVSLLSVSDVAGAGRGPVQIYRERQVSSRLKWLRVEVASADDSADEAVESIARAHGPAEAGQSAGKVFVVGLEDYGDLRNDEPDAAVYGY